jgi:hypothetical protein
MGFGVLAKLYAMAAELQEACATSGTANLCTMTASELVEAFQSGIGMGQLFKEYGKPAIRGVGHVKQQTKEYKDGAGPPSHAGPKDKSTGGPPPHAGSNDDQTGGPPPHAGSNNGQTGGPPPHAGPKKPKKDK